MEYDGDGKVLSCPQSFFPRSTIGYCREGLREALVETVIRPIIRNRISKRTQALRQSTTAAL